MKKPKIVGIGELLWDVLPAGRRMGGAPVNFAFYAKEEGADAHVISAVGEDESGRELLDGITRLGIGTSAVEHNAHPTSTVDVSLDNAGIPTYRIHEGVAWDYIVPSPETETVVAGADAICWGSLAQRNSISRNSIEKIIAASPKTCLKLFDINLRLDYYDETIIRESLEAADILKLNEDELPVVARYFALGKDPEEVISRLIERFALRYVVYTEGSRGSRITAADGQSSFLETPRVKVADTVGAGDAFTAAFAVSLLKGLPLTNCHRRAVDVAAFVCTQHGAITPLPKEIKQTA